MSQAVAARDPAVFSPKTMTALLLVGVFAFKRGLLSVVFHMAFPLTAEGWLKLSARWGFFFLFLATMNEIVWRNFPTEWWVNYKLFGVIHRKILIELK